MQPKQKKIYIPVILSTIVVIGFTFFILFKNTDFFNQANQKIITQGQGTFNIKKTEEDVIPIPIKSLQKIESSFTDDISIGLIGLIQDNDTYDYLGKLLQADLNKVDFAKYDVLLTHFYSDGCGLVVEQLKLKENELQVKLMLPKDLRNKKELNCTTIAIPNIVFIVIPKTTFKTAYFTRNNEPSDTKFNIYTIPLINELFQTKQ